MPDDQCVLGAEPVRCPEHFRLGRQQEAFDGQPRLLDRVTLAEERASGLLELPLVRHHGRCDCLELEARPGAESAVAVAVHAGGDQGHVMARDLQAVGQGHERADVAMAAPGLDSDFHVREGRPLQPG